jgi:hypothetical protein
MMKRVTSEWRVHLREVLRREETTKEGLPLFRTVGLVPRAQNIISIICLSITAKSSKKIRGRN